MARFQDEFISTAPSTSPFNIAQPSSPYPPSESSSSPNIQVKASSLQFVIFKKNLFAYTTKINIAI